VIQNVKADTSERVTDSKSVSLMIEQKSVQRAQIRAAYEQSENDFNMLMNIFFGVKKEEDRAKINKDFENKKY
jgi:hypothetical protein